MFHFNHFLRRRGLYSVLLCVLLVVTSLPLHAADGTLDPTFGGDGKVVTPLGSNGEYIGDIVIQADGKLVVAGWFGLARLLSTGGLDPTFGKFGDGGVTLPVDIDFSNLLLQPDGKLVAAGRAYNGSNDDIALARYNTDGSLDTTFASDGKAVTDFGADEYATALILQPDGKLVVAGTTGTSLGVLSEFALARYNADGSLDTTFDGDGTLFSDFGGASHAEALILQSDGKLVAFGRVDASCALLRYNVDGLLDTSFDSDGKVVTDFGGFYCTSLVLQPDDKLVAAGSAYNGSNTDFVLARYNTDGSPDSTFGGNGKVITDFDGHSDVGLALLLQPDGKLVIAGDTQYGSSSRKATIVRYNTDGSLDASFDGDGKVLTDFGLGYSTIAALVLQSDGKLVAAGKGVARYNSDGSLDPTFDGDGVYIFLLGDAAIEDIAIQPDGKFVAAGWADQIRKLVLVHYNADGSLDTSFDGDGKVVVDFWSGSNIHESQPNVIVLLPDGKLVAAGSAYDGSINQFALVRYNADGSLDTSFDGDGKVLTDFWNSASATALALQPDGKLIAAGTTSTSGYYDFVLARYNTDGSLDSSFDGDGKLVTSLGLYIHGNVRALLVQPDGKLVTAGYAKNSWGIGNSFVLMRYNANGSLDTSFDYDGKLFTNFAIDDHATVLLLQPDGKLIAAGWSGEYGNTAFALARYHPNGQLDTSFDGDGKIRTVLGESAGVNALLLQPEGKFIAAGSSDYDFALVRYNADGSLDTSFDSDGKIITDFGGYKEYVTALLSQPNGKLVAGGRGANTFALARYLVNMAPIAVDESFDVVINTGITVPAPGVLGNDSDLNGDLLTAVQVRGPSNGSLTLNADGSFTYKPIPGFSGVDSFSYQANDRLATSNVIIVMIRVLTGSELTFNLLYSIQELNADGVLNYGQYIALSMKLSEVALRLDEGKIQQAINMLHAFVNQVTDLIATGILTPEVGQPLIDSANVIIGQVQSGTGTTGSGMESEQAGFTIYLPHVSR